MHGKNKSNLMWLYNDKYNLNSYEKEKVFSYRAMHFYFVGTSPRNPEKLLMHVEFSASLISEQLGNDIIPLKSYLLGVLSPVVNDLSHSYINTNKDAREKPCFEIQSTNELVLDKNSIYYDCNKETIILTIHFYVPLINALYINAKSAIRAVKDVLDHVKNAITTINKAELHEYILCYRNQLNIRKYMRNHDLCAFVANGSILPREGGTTNPMMNSIPFHSPKELQISIPLGNGITIEGMGIKCGITVITGGGYSGKSTLIDAIESGVYNHIPGDGREYVITDNSALKIYAEDGRPVRNIDLSPFFSYLPQNNKITNFSTDHASGSVSQAANIIEAVCGGSKLLLIDEDKSATNFMLRDSNMRKIIKKEPIIPFTDRVSELYCEKKVSTILVIGGSSEYLSCADCVILMEDYVAKDVTSEIKMLDIPANTSNFATANWTKSRRLILKQTTQPFLFFRTVKNENEKRIILDDYNADITLLTSVITHEQMNTLACVMERLLTDKKSDNEELIKKLSKIINKLFSDGWSGLNSLLVDTAFQWFEEIRPIDAFCCANRMRGLSFSKKDGDVYCNE